MMSHLFKVDFLDKLVVKVDDNKICLTHQDEDIRIMPYLKESKLKTHTDITRSCICNKELIYKSMKEINSLRNESKITQKQFKQNMKECYKKIDPYQLIYNETNDIDYDNLIVEDVKCEIELSSEMEIDQQRAYFIYLLVKTKTDTFSFKFIFNLTPTEASTEDCLVINDVSYNLIINTEETLLTFLSFHRISDDTITYDDLFVGLWPNDTVNNILISTAIIAIVFSTLYALYGCL